MLGFLHDDFIFGRCNYPCYIRILLKLKTMMAIASENAKISINMYVKMIILVNFSDFNGFKRANFNRLTSSTGLKKKVVQNKLRKYH